jgi:hypothetical protein
MTGLPLLLPLLAACGEPPPGPKEDDTGGTILPDADGDGRRGDADCDDAEPLAWTGADETCDGVDNDCDGDTDESAIDAITSYLDADGDGYGDPTAPFASCELLTPYVEDATDCDDTRSDIHPGADEADCADPVDYNCDGSVGYTDADGDGFAACEECGDDDAAVSPAASESCNDVDDDCDGDTDEDDAIDAATWYADADGDGYGDPAVVAVACDAPEGYLADATDCDDTDGAEYPGADEVCDGDDDDCDGVTDEDDASDAPSWYADADGDGYGDPSAATSACSAPAGHVADATDCDDGDARENPAASEQCDGDDDDCDGVADEDEAVDAGTWYRDADGDGFGDAGDTRASCDQPSGYVEDDTDCDDGDGDTFPGADEYCDGEDDDCDGQTDEDDAVDVETWYRDADGDGYGSSSSDVGCDQPSGYVANSTDCDDTDANEHPGATEYCDKDDDDCDGSVDESSAADAETWYADADADGYGDSATTQVACDLPSGYSADATDCDDADASVNPGASEACNEVDDDCDGSVDWDLRVPDDYGTIQGAINASVDGETVCVESGTYKEKVNFGGRDITVSGEDGAASTTINANGGYPTVTMNSGESAGAVLEGFTVTGGKGATGAGIYVSSSSPTLRDLVVSGNSCTSSSCTGTGIYLSSADATLDGVEVKSNTQSATGSSPANYGAGIYSYSSAPTLTDVYVHDNTQGGSGGTYTYAYGAGIYLGYYSDAVFDEVRTEDNYAYFTSGTYAYGMGAGLYVYYGSTLDWTGGTVDGNHVSGSTSYVYGSGPGAYLYYNADVSMSQVSVTENYVSGYSGYGAGVYDYYSTLDLSNVIVAGNYVSASYYAYAGGIYAGASSDVSATNVDIVGNSLSARYTSGGGIYVDSGASIDLLNTAIVSNTLSGTYTYGGAVYAYSSGSISYDIDYCNAYGNTSTQWYGGIADPSGSNGNFSKDAGYTSTSGSDAAAWDLSLTTSSSMVNTGDPTVYDADGSRSDVGAYGGPQGSW